MKRFAFLNIFLLNSLSASSFENITVSLSNIILISQFLVILIVAFLLYKSINKNKKLYKVIDEKDEKIQWLRKVFAQKESSLNKKIKEYEDKIVELNHKIEKLEQNLKEGTKNQVVLKLESLQRKREELLNKLKG